jgi:hypothetical protein
MSESTFLRAALFVLLIATGSVRAQQPGAQVAVYTPPVLTISGDAPVIRNCGAVAGKPEVHLTAQTTRGTTPTRYVWTSDAGRIEGNGPTATWTLDGVAPGYYHASLQASAGTTNDECQVFASTVISVECPPVPDCPRLQILCPSGIEANQRITFDSLVSGSLGTSPFVYNWTISGGSIIEGQGTRSISVDTAGLEGQSLTATAVLAGYDASNGKCSASCSVSIPVPQACRKFDEYPEITRNDEKARLDNLSVELQNDPFATAYVTINPAAERKAGTVEKRAANIADYLINSRGMDSKRIIIKTGAPRSTSVVEIWLCPRGIVH